MTVEHAHSLDNGVYQQQPKSPNCGGGPGPALVEYLDEEHGGYMTPEEDSRITSATTLGGKLSRMLVLRDFQKAEVWRATVFEGIATFGMLFLGNLCSISILEAEFSHPVLAIAICQGLVMSLAILAAAPASGGHVNPVISWVEVLTGHTTPVRGALYIAAHILGSIVAAVASKATVGNDVAVKYSLGGGCWLRSQVSATSGVVGVDAGRALLLEVVLTFFVLFIAYSVALDPPRLPRIGYTFAPFIVGGLVGLCIFAGGNLVSGYGGAGINPARCIGPAVVLGGPLWTDHWVFWVGPTLSGLAMAALYHTIPPTHVQVYKLRKAARARKAIKSSRSMSLDDKPFATKATNCGLAHAIGSRIRNACSPDRSASEKPMNDAPSNAKFSVRTFETLQTFL